MLKNYEKACAELRDKGIVVLGSLHALAYTCTYMYTLWSLVSTQKSLPSPGAGGMTSVLRELPGAMNDAQCECLYGVFAYCVILGLCVKA